MEETALPNPVLKDDDAEGARLLAAAEKQDTEGIPTEQSSAQTSAPRAAEGEEAPTPEVRPDNSEASAEPARDELGRFTKADGTKSEPNETAPKKEPVLNTLSPDRILEAKEQALGLKEDSAFAKAKKDAERKDRSWKALEEEKARVRQEAERVNQQWHEIEQRRNQAAPDTFTSKQYDDAAVDFRKLAREQMARGEVDEAAGNFDLATKASEAAGKVRETEQKAQFEQQKGGFEQTWRGHMDATIKEIPELANRESPLAKELTTLFQQEPVFNFIPDGFRKAVGVAQLRLAAAEASGLAEKNKQLTAELAKYQRLTALDGGSPTSHVGPKPFEAMTEDEQGAYLQRVSADRSIAA